MEHTLKLSIVVPTYNVEEYIGNCLISLMNQDVSSEDYEVIVINDGATDNSLQIAEDMADKHDNIRVISQENQGLSAARNTGFAHAKGTYLYFIDSDDYIAFNSLGYVLKTLEENDLDVLGIHLMETERLDIYESTNINQSPAEELEVMDGIRFIAEHKYYNNAWWYFAKRSFLDQMGYRFPVGRFVEDANYTAKVFVEAKRIAWSKLDFYRYVHRATSIMHKKDPSHYEKMIRDYGANVAEFEEQIQQLEQRQHPHLKNCIKRLRFRQESFIFFLVMRIIRSQLPVKRIKESLKHFSQTGNYPLRVESGFDYQQKKFALFVFLVNNPRYLGMATRVFRLGRRS